MTTLYLVRHGQTTWNAEGRIQGHQNSVLTESGRSQVAALADKLADIHFDALYSSDLARAYQSAEILAAKRQLVILTSQALRERSSGRLEGQLRHEIKEELDAIWQAINQLPPEERWHARVAEDAESEAEVMARFIPFIREIAVAHDGQSVLVVSHGALIRTFLVHLGSYTYDEMKGADFSNAGYVVFQSDGIEFKVEQIVGLEIARKEAEIGA